MQLIFANKSLTNNRNKVERSSREAWDPSENIGKDGRQEMRDDRSRCQAGSCWGLGSLWTSRSGPVQLTWIHTRVETAFAVGKRMIQRSINKQAS